MFESFQAIDTPLEWGESAVGVIAITGGLVVGYWIWSKVLKLLFVAFFLLILVIPILLIANGTWSSWQEIAGGSIVSGLLFSIILLPFLKLYEMRISIKLLEKKLGITKEDIRKFKAEEDTF